MSPDVTFAAQFWNWPDPAIKRDMQGRILFVNAAFLQLYGGSVEAWTGNLIQGWHAPQDMNPAGQPSPYRFEIRTPSQDPTQPEQIYDWLEQPLTDGTAFALARNITAYIQQTPVQQSPVPPSAADQAAYAATETMEIVETQIEAQHITEAAPETQQVAPQMEAPQSAEPVTAAPVEAAHQTAPQSEEAFAAPEIENAPAYQDVEERSFERRALPIEANSAVLGNNWRDAVIAKAVGVDSAEEHAQNASTAAQNEPVSQPAPAGNEDGACRILLAEDNAINALLTRTLLEAEGHIVETVEDGALAVEAMKSQHFDLIFMDMRMPNMDGLESTRKIRQLPNVPKSLPIIALTANAFDDDRNACFDSGMNDFMTKPVSAEELSQMVKNWAGTKQLEKTG